jgi:stearoyl-CoA desaturase (delta-9 desaturase)
MQNSHLKTEAVALPIAAPNAQPLIPIEPLKRISAGERIANLIAIIIPFGALLFAITSLWGRGFGWVDFGLLGIMYILTVLGITVGFHRLFTHRAFETTGTIAFLFGVFGSMAMQGRLFHWVGLHRRHHQHSDEINDPHSPHGAGKGLRGTVRGIWHSHLGWFFSPTPLNHEKYVKDLKGNYSLRVIDRLFFVWVLFGVLIPAGVGGAISQSWNGAFWGFIWGGLVRILLVHHVTWSINSICHLWGSQPYSSGDQSRNNALFGVLAFGEGWHNTHHAFPTSARHGLRWWQLDMSYWLIRSLEAVGLAWNIKLPSKKSQLARATPSREKTRRSF